MSFDINKFIAKRLSKFDFNHQYHDAYFNQPHDKFILSERNKLNKNMSIKKLVYLDLNYWINIRRHLFNEKRTGYIINCFFY